MKNWLFHILNWGSSLLSLALILWLYNKGANTFAWILPQFTVEENARAVTSLFMFLVFVGEIAFMGLLCVVELILQVRRIIKEVVK